MFHDWLPLTEQTQAFCRIALFWVTELETEAKPPQEKASQHVCLVLRNQVREKAGELTLNLGLAQDPGYRIKKAEGARRRVSEACACWASMRTWVQSHSSHVKGRHGIHLNLSTGTLETSKCGVPLASQSSWQGKLQVQRESLLSHKGMNDRWPHLTPASNLHTHKHTCIHMHLSHAR